MSANDGSLSDKSQQFRASLKNATQYPASVLSAAMLAPHIGLRGVRYVMRRPMILRDLKNRFHVETLEVTEEIHDAADIEAHISDLAEQENWLALAAYMGHLDQSRAATASGRRHLDIALYFMRGCISDFYEYPNERCFEFSFKHDDALMARLSKIQSDNPDNYMLAAILARLHLDCGWIERSNEWSDARDASGFTAMNAHFSKARDLVTRFDPIAYNSPLLAEVQYRLCIGIEDGHERLDACFADWSDLDPTNPAAYKLHAFYCLPRWFGDFEILEREADNAATATQEQWGDAAYAVMMLKALSFDHGAALYLKPERVLAGINDLFTAYKSDPYIVTDMLDTLSDALKTEYRVVSGPDRALKRVGDKLRGGLGPVLRSHLTAFCRPAWSKSFEEFLEWAACAYASELENGATVELKEHGAKIYGEAG